MGHLSQLLISYRTMRTSEITKLRILLPIQPEYSKVIVVNLLGANQVKVGQTSEELLSRVLTLAMGYIH